MFYWPGIKLNILSKAYWFNVILPLFRLTLFRLLLPFLSSLSMLDPRSFVLVYLNSPEQFMVFLRHFILFLNSEKESWSKDFLVFYLLYSALTSLNLSISLGVIFKNSEL